MSKKSEDSNEEVWNWSSNIDSYIEILLREAQDYSSEGDKMKARMKKIRKNALIKVRNNLLSEHVKDFANEIKVEYDNKDNEYYCFYYNNDFIRIPKNHINIGKEYIGDVGFAYDKGNSSPDMNLVNCLKQVKENTEIDPNDMLEKKEINYENKVYVQLFKDITWDLD